MGYMENQMDNLIEGGIRAQEEQMMEDYHRKIEGILRRNQVTETYSQRVALIQDTIQTFKLFKN